MFNVRPDIPWLYVRPSELEDEPPGFRVTPEVLPGNGANPFGPSALAYAPNASAFAPSGAGLGDTSAPTSGIGSPLDFLTGQSAGGARVDVGMPFPDATSLLFPQLGRSQPSTFGLQALSKVESDEPVPGFRVQAPEPPGFRVRPPDPPGFRVGADRPDVNALPEAGNPWSIGYNPDVGAEPLLGYPRSEAAPRRDAGVYSASSPVYDPFYIPESPSDRVQKALDEIDHIYGISRAQPTGLLNRPYPPADSEVGDNTPPTFSEVFDPQYIVPTQGIPGGGSRPPPPSAPRPNPSPQGPRPPSSPKGSESPQERRPQRTDNGPPGPPPNTTATPAPSYPPPSSSAQAAQLPRGPTGQPTVDLGGPAAIAKFLAPKPDLDSHIERIGPVARARGEDPTANQSVPPGGLITQVGVQMHPNVGPPASDEIPNHEHLKNGLIGEFNLTNRIATLLPGERVIHYGNAAGAHGADIISVSPEGVISVWDSKWRGGARSMSEGGRAHQGSKSLDRLCDQVQQQVKKAVASGRLALHIATKAMENAEARNFFINTVGTGSAHGGVTQYINGCEASEFRRF